MTTLIFWCIYVYYLGFMQYRTVQFVSDNNNNDVQDYEDDDDDYKNLMICGVV